MKMVKCPKCDSINLLLTVTTTTRYIQLGDGQLIYMVREPDSPPHCEVTTVVCHDCKANLTDTIFPDWNEGILKDWSDNNDSDSGTD